LRSEHQSRHAKLLQTRPLLHHAQYFSLNSSGNLSFNTTAPPGLLNLPESALTNIVEQTLGSHHCHEIHLEAFTDMQDLCAIFYARMRLHDNYFKAFLDNNAFALSMMTSDAHTTFDFGKLERLLNTRFKYRCKRWSYQQIQFSKLANYSNTLLCINTDHYHNSQVRCPEIWIKGIGDIVDIIPTGNVDRAAAEPTKANPTSSRSLDTGYMGDETPPVPEVDGLARGMHSYLKWSIEEPSR
jgi:hypothetical protein